MKISLTLLALVGTIFCTAQQPNIIPAPLKAEAQKGSFTLSPTTVIVAGNRAEQATINFFNDYLKTYYGFSLKQVTTAKANYISLSTPTFIQKPENEERYTLAVTPTHINIIGDGTAGTFYGMQSLIQLFPTTATKGATAIKINSINIEDQPRFSYRGMHLDVGRHFFEVDFIKKYIDYIALHKMNTFHWHLTEDQGWRIEIKRYPKLTEIGGYRNGTIIGRYPGKGNDNLHYGGFYTQEQIKDIVQYAADRHITVIPEIELPGHSSAAIAAYPELSCFPQAATQLPKQCAWNGDTTGKQVQQTWGVFEDVFCPTEYTFNFIENVLDEVMALFPSAFIHIGGDECPKDAWKKSAFCQQLIKEKGLKDEHGLQSYFIQRIEKYVNRKGKNIIGWDEILEGGLAPNATVMSWRGEQGGIEAAQQKHNVIMTPGGWCYFDHSQSKQEDSVTIGGYTTVEKVYSYEPIPAALTAEEGKYVLGAQGNVWTEYMKNTRKVEYQVFPRMAALSEVLWSPKATRDWSKFEPRLMQQFNRYDLWQANYSKAFWNIQDSILPGKAGPILLKLDAKDKTLQYQLSHPNPAKKQHTPTTITLPYTLHPDGGTLQVTGSKAGKTVVTYKKTFSLNKATGKTIVISPEASKTYPGNGGNFGLVNGAKSENGFNSPEWMGWSGKTVTITLDLGQETTAGTVNLYVWEQQPSWIFLPEKITLQIAGETTDGEQITLTQPSTGWPDKRKISIPLPPNTTAKTITLTLYPVLKIPEGNPGAGKPAWVFVDEVEVL
jgi:hexosaminidase